MAIHPEPDISQLTHNTHAVPNIIPLIFAVTHSYVIVSLRRQNEHECHYLGACYAKSLISHGI